MKFLPLLPVIILLLGSTAIAQKAPADSAETARIAAYRSIVDSAYQAYQRQDYARSADLYADAFIQVRMPTPTDLYNAACAASLAGQVGRGYGFLHRSIERGWE